MSIDPSDMVEYASKLLTNNSDEMELRNVVNRAYYGAFLAARDAAGITNSSGSVHKEVSDFYKCKKKTYVQNGLDSLKKYRQKADYKPQDNVSAQDAKACCRQARKVLKEL